MFTIKTYLQHPQVSSDQNNPKTTTALVFYDIVIYIYIYIYLPRFSLKMQDTTTA